MSNRKQTPDVLGAVLGGPRDYPAFSEEPEPAGADLQPADQLLAAPTVPPDQPRTGAAEARSQTIQPQEWEYREVIFRDYRGWRTRVVNGRELGDWKNSPTLIEYLAQAGMEGWELVSVGDRHNNQKEAYLKRPKR